MTGETTTVTWETNVHEEEHIPMPFCLQWITHKVTTWWKKFTSVSNDAKEKNSSMMEMNPKAQAIAIHFINPANLEICNLHII
jgi:hypothetical protein